MAAIGGRILGEERSRFLSLRRRRAACVGLDRGHRPGIGWGGGGDAVGCGPVGVGPTQQDRERPGPPARPPSLQRQPVGVAKIVGLLPGLFQEHRLLRFLKVSLPSQRVEAAAVHLEAPGRPVVGEAPHHALVTQKVSETHTEECGEKCGLQ
jgi:hypothetical protein